jgi:hypothetical protein
MALYGKRFARGIQEVAPLSAACNTLAAGINSGVARIFVDGRSTW